MSFEFESVNHSFQEVSQDPELQHRSQSDTSGELADSELEAVAGGCPKPQPKPNKPREDGKKSGESLATPFHWVGGVWDGFWGSF
jgi:hypothetical protein